jgi:hypothetical protein
MLRRGQLRPRQLARNCVGRGHRIRATIGAGTGGLAVFLNAVASPHVLNSGASVTRRVTVSTLRGTTTG